MRQRALVSKQAIARWCVGLQTMATVVVCGRRQAFLCRISVVAVWGLDLASNGQHFGGDVGFLQVDVVSTLLWTCGVC